MDGQRTITIEAATNDRKRCVRGMPTANAFEALAQADIEADPKSARAQGTGAGGSTQ